MSWFADTELLGSEVRVRVRVRIRKQNKKKTKRTSKALDTKPLMTKLVVSGKRGLVDQGLRYESGLKSRPLLTAFSFSYVCLFIA